MSPRYTLRLLAFVVLLLLAVPVRTAVATSHGATSDDGASGGGPGSVATEQTPILVGSNTDREEVASEADWSEAEMVRGVLSPIVTQEVAVIEAQDIASGDSESAGTQTELTINGVRIE